MLTFPDGPSRRGRSSSAGTHTPLTRPVIPPASMPPATSHVTRVQRPGVCPSGIRHAPRAPSPAAVYPLQRDIERHVRGRYPSFLAHTGSGARPNPSDDFSFVPYTTGPCRLLPAPAGRWHFPTLSLHSLHSRLVPYPVVSLRCMYPFLHEERRPRNRVYVLGTPKRFPDSIFSPGVIFRGCRHSSMFRLLCSLDPPGCPHLAVLCPTKRQGLIHHAAIVRLPNTNCGITTYPNRVIGTAGPSPAGMQSCRLLKTPNDPLLPSAHYQSRGGETW